MCTGCLLVSALMLFTPAAPESQPTRLTATPEGIAEVVFQQPTSTPTVSQETQAAIAQMIQAVPQSSELSVLREGLESLQIKLRDVTQDAEADALIDSHMQALADRISAAPNYDQLMSALAEIMESRAIDHPAIQKSGLTRLQSRLQHPTTLKATQQNRQWGWLA